MVIVNAKGHELQVASAKDSYNRRALQISNNIVKSLGTIGVGEDDIKIHLETLAMKKATAFVSWYFQHTHLYYSYGAVGKFVDNLSVVQKVLEVEIGLLIEGKRTPEEFIAEFREDHDVAEQRKVARQVLGLQENEDDIESINKAYKNLAKEHHPDKESGDTTKFKEINHAHKILKRELR